MSDRPTAGSDLHWAPGLSLHSGVQQWSELMCSSPGSHSSPCSTREFPHTLTFLCLKQVEALDLRRFTMERLLQLEKSWTHRRQLVHHMFNLGQHQQLEKSWTHRRHLVHHMFNLRQHQNMSFTLLFAWSPLTAMGYMTYFPPWSSRGAQSGMSSGSCSAPKLWPSSWVVTRSASCGDHTKDQDYFLLRCRSLVLFSDWSSRRDFKDKGSGEM